MRRTAKAVDRLIDEIYREHCAGLQIDVMRIGKLFDMARKLLAQGYPRQEIGARMVEFVKGDAP